MRSTAGCTMGPVLVLAVVGLAAMPVRPASAMPAPARWALVMGHNQSSDPNVAPLRYADDDALAMHELLGEAGVHSVLLVTLDADTRRLHPQVRPAGAATLPMLRATMVELAQRMTTAKAAGQAVEFIVYFSGHGSVSAGEGYIELDGGRLTRGTLYEEILARSPATTNHIIVDACKSYFLVFGKGPGGERTPIAAPFVDRAGMARFPNTGFILSSSSDSDSHEWERFAGGIFSHEVRSALRGAADIDGDGSISYAELGAFLSTANQSIPNARYRPDFMVRSPGGTLQRLSSALLSWPPLAAALRVDTGIGHIFCESAVGLRLLDVNVADGTTFVLHLPEERPVFVRQDTNSTEFVLSDQAASSLSQLVPRAATVSAKGALHLAFESLFNQPFRSQAVSRYLLAYQQDGDPLMRLEPSAVLKLRLARGERVRSAKVAMLATALSAAGLAAGGQLWAYQRRNAGAGVSQERQAELNGHIRALNATSVALASLAGAAGATWLALVIVDRWPGRSRPLALAPMVSPGHRGLTLGLQLRR